MLLDDAGEIVEEGYRYLGEMSNNQAEYRALLLALESLQKYTINSLAVHADSELMVRQLEGKYKVKNQGLKPLYQKAIKLLSHFNSYSLKHVLRDQNAHADELANRAIDQQVGV